MSDTTYKCDQCSYVREKPITHGEISPSAACGGTMRPVEDTKDICLVCNQPIDSDKRSVLIEATGQKGFAHSRCALIEVGKKIEAENDAIRDRLTTAERAWNEARVLLLAWRQLAMDAEPMMTAMSRGGVVGARRWLDRLKEMRDHQPCGHSAADIISTDEGTAHCGRCEAEAKGQ